MDGKHDNLGVRAHYAALAASYNRGANKACTSAYEALAARALAGTRNLIEIGAGARPVTSAVAGARRTWTDLSLDMLLAGKGARGDGLALVTDGQRLPFADAVFDGAASINVLEHVPDPSAFLMEVARVLRPGARVLLVTPNGDMKWLLDWLEKMRLKLPEGPHQFRKTDEVAGWCAPFFRKVEHSEFLAFPAGPQSLVTALDRAIGRGLFQFYVGERI